MKRTCLTAQAALVVGLIAIATNAWAGLTYFDAQITDITVNTGKTSTLFPANTIFANGTSFTAAPYDATTNPTGNWTQDNTAPVPPGTNNGSDNAWRQRNNAAFGNVDASTNGTVYESRGVSGGPNTEQAPTLKTTISVPAGLQGASHAVYAMFWSDGSQWQIGASLTQQNGDLMPVYVGGSSFTPSGYTFETYDQGETFTTLAAGYPVSGAPQQFINDASHYTSSDAGAGAGTGRHFWAAYLGDVTLGSSLTAYIDDSQALTATQMADNGGANHRTWYDGLAIGDAALGLAPPPDRAPPTPEPASIVLLGIGMVGFGMLARRRAC
ncbi:MAG TPA: PEP-CTERM sorting domain-containing protein [Lacipirellulaceae bacterium]|jgi:hypothetical protein